MMDKKQLHKQALYLSLIILLSWFVFATYVLVPEVIAIIAGEMNTFKYTIIEQAIAFIPALGLSVITIVLNYLLKPDLRKYFNLHIVFGLVTILICFLLLISFHFLSMWAEGSIYANLAYMHMNLYWIVPVISLLMEIGLLIIRRAYQKTKELVILIVSHAGICLVITYVVELFIIGSHI